MDDLNVVMEEMNKDADGSGWPLLKDTLQIEAEAHDCIDMLGRPTD